MPATLTTAAFDFLGQAPLQDKAWFEANREICREHLQEPLRGLVDALTPTMAAIDPDMTGSVSRIHRDMRFAGMGKSLYRESMWICFGNRNAQSDGLLGFFFEVFTDRYQYGAGFYSASTAKMNRYRAAIDRDPDLFQRIVGSVPPQFAPMGETYKKSRAGHLPEALRPWYDKKNIWFQVERPLDDLVTSPDLAGHLKAEWGSLATVYRFLRDV